MSENEKQLILDEPKEKLSASERMRKIWEMRKSKLSTEQGSEPAKATRKKRTGGNISGAAASLRMKKAWATRRKNLSLSVGAAPAKASARPDTHITINGDKALFQRYMGYIEAARNLGDFTILNGENFSRVEQALKSKLR